MGLLRPKRRVQSLDNEYMVVGRGKKRRADQGMVCLGRTERKRGIGQKESGPPVRMVISKAKRKSKLKGLCASCVREMEEMGSERRRRKVGGGWRVEGDAVGTEGESE